MGKSSCSSVASSAAKRSKHSLTTSLGRASCLSTLLTQTIGFRPIFSALPTTNFVCGIGPSAASTSTIAPSTMERMRSTSPPKSAWPGVSTMLTRTSFHTTEVALARMVMPRSRSRSFESITRSATRWFSRNAPDCCSRRSTSVVLPWSTWAMMAMFLSFMAVRTFERGANRKRRPTAAPSLDGRHDGDATKRRPATPRFSFVRRNTQVRRGREGRRTGVGAGAAMVRRSLAVDLLEARIPTVRTCQGRRHSPSLWTGVFRRPMAPPRSG